MKTKTKVKREEIYKPAKFSDAKCVKQQKHIGLGLSVKQYNFISKIRKDFNFLTDGEAIRFIIDNYYHDRQLLS